MREYGCCSGCGARAVAPIVSGPTTRSRAPAALGGPPLRVRRAVSRDLVSRDAVCGRVRVPTFEVRADAVVRSGGRCVWNGSGGAAATRLPVGCSVDFGCIATTFERTGVDRCGRPFDPRSPLTPRPVSRPGAVGWADRARVMAVAVLVDSPETSTGETATVPQRRVERFGFAITIEEATGETGDRAIAASSEVLRRDADSAKETARSAPRDCWEGRNCVERTVIGIPCEAR